ncbi:hypothetical protein BCEP27_30014 [Burkholderia cepacia]
MMAQRIYSGTSRLMPAIIFSVHSLLEQGNEEKASGIGAGGRRVGSCRLCSGTNCGNQGHGQNHSRCVPARDR